jgi:sugar-phosphatase
VECFNNRQFTNVRLIKTLLQAKQGNEVNIFAVMQPDTVIFDMDGLLIDSEPLWNEAAATVLGNYGILLSPEQYITTTGLRTREFVTYWFAFFNIPLNNTGDVEQQIINRVIELVAERGKAMPGLEHILDFFTDRNFKVGLASSSPLSLIDVVTARLQIRDRFNVITSAAHLKYGKPHPGVYLNCASALHSLTTQCICFEDSFPGMIAAKAASMKCVVVPDTNCSNELKWHAADLKIASLQNFNELLLQSL